MLIGIDASRAAKRQRTGTEAYAYFLINALIGLTAVANIRLRLYFNAPPAANLFPTAPHVEQVVMPFPRLWTHVRLAWELQHRPPDVFFTPAHVIPLTYRGPSVATVHDLGFHYFPQAHTRRQAAYLRWSTRLNGRLSRRLIADSRATQADLVRFYGVNPAKIDVIYPAVDPTLAPVTDTQQLTAVQQRYGVRTPYLLYIGTLQPRKNLARLVAAYAASGATHSLVLAGKRGWLSHELQTAVAGLPTPVQQRILLPGFVAETDKAALISGATAVLYPSLYEGFGFPVLEAQACGTAVLAADNSALPEVAGQGALLINAEDTLALADALQRLVADADLRADLVRRGKTNLQRFSWQQTAVATLASLTAAAQSPDINRAGSDF